MSELTSFGALVICSLLTPLLLMTQLHYIVTLISINLLNIFNSYGTINTALAGSRQKVLIKKVDWK
jgi:hypothetical protein